MALGALFNQSEKSGMLLALLIGAQNLPEGGQRRRVMGRYHAYCMCDRDDTMDGDASAMMPEMYERLRSAARRHLEHQPPGSTLQPTALVHEAFLKMAGTDQLHWESRAHFLSLASRIMKQVLIDAARSRKRQKRGGDPEFLKSISSLIETRKAALKSLQNDPDVQKATQTLKEAAAPLARG